MPRIKATSLWEQDSAQFPRLLAEITATIKLSDGQVTDLCESMDISAPQLSELFERAATKWEELKRRYASEKSINEGTGQRAQLRGERMPGEMRIPILSTSHIKPSTLEILGDISPGRVAEYPEGAFVYIGNPECDEELTHVPELLPVAKWFRENYPNENWLRLDRDGDEIDDAPVFSW